MWAAYLERCLTTSRYVSTQKKPPVSVSRPGELVIRVHLPIKCSQVEHHTPDKFVQRSVIFLNKKPPVGVNLLGE
jgi:hypothetical protein